MNTETALQAALNIDNIVKVSDLARRYLDLQVKAAELKEAMDTLAAQIRAATPVGTKLTTLDGITISVRANKRFDENKAREVLPHDVLVACTRPTVDRALVQSYVPPAVYQQCQVERGDPVVSIKATT